MFKRIQTYRFFNAGTQRALFERIEGYVDKEANLLKRLEGIQEEGGLQRIYRFDRGQNPEGCDPALLAKVARIMADPQAMDYFRNYPDLDWTPLKDRIADLHGINPDWILLSAGLDQFLSMICASFFEGNDRFLINYPSFFLFDEYSQRMGAIPVSLSLPEEDQFDWTGKTMDDYNSILSKLHLKLIWIANPNNPTGRVMPLDALEDLIRTANEHLVFVVVDEAYGEYTDPHRGVSSASRFLEEYPNLIVLRTFSKAYGLANFRVAYGLTSEPQIAQALTLHRPYYPITRLGFELACGALDRMDYLETVREKTRQMRDGLCRSISAIGNFTVVDSVTSTLMLRHHSIHADLLRQELEKQGIIVSPIPGAGSVSKHYIRITVGLPDENEILIKGLEKLA